MLKFKAQLRIWSKVYSLNDLKSYLGEPSKGHSLGDEYSRGKRVREESLWVLKSTLSSNDSFKDHLNQLIDFLDAKSDVLSSIKSQCQMDFFCMLRSDNGQGTTVLPLKVMKNLALYDLDLVLDVYVDDE